MNKAKNIFKEVSFKAICFRSVIGHFFVTLMRSLIQIIFTDYNYHSFN